MREGLRERTLRGLVFADKVNQRFENSENPFCILMFLSFSPDNLKVPSSRQDHAEPIMA
jgi:hypothetical protein